jgi:hypothetical protein
MVGLGLGEHVFTLSLSLSYIRTAASLSLSGAAWLHLLVGGVCMRTGALLSIIEPVDLVDLVFHHPAPYPICLVFHKCFESVFDV